MCAAVVVSLSIGRRRSRGDRPTVAVAASCDPPDVATGPAGGCPPVCQRSEFPHRRNVGIIHYCAVGCKGEQEKRAKRTKGQNVKSDKMPVILVSRQDGGSSYGRDRSPKGPGYAVKGFTDRIPQ